MEVDNYKAEIAKTCGDYADFSQGYHTLDDILCGKEGTNIFRKRVELITRRLIGIAKRREDIFLTAALEELYKKHSTHINLYKKLLLV